MAKYAPTEEFNIAEPIATFVGMAQEWLRQSGGLTPPTAFLMHDKEGHVAAAIFNPEGLRFEDQVGVIRHFIVANKDKGRALGVLHCCPGHFTGDADESGILVQFEIPGGKTQRMFGRLVAGQGPARLEWEAMPELPATYFCAAEPAQEFKN